MFNWHYRLVILWVILLNSWMYCAHGLTVICHYFGVLVLCMTVIYVKQNISSGLGVVVQVIIMFYKTRKVVKLSDKNTHPKAFGVSTNAYFVLYIIHKSLILLSCREDILQTLSNWWNPDICLLMLVHFSLF